MKLEDLFPLAMSDIKRTDFSLSLSLSLVKGGEPSDEKLKFSPGKCSVHPVMTSVTLRLTLDQDFQHQVSRIYFKHYFFINYMWLAT